MMKIIKRLKLVDYKRIIWILAVSETIHNLEEAVWLPASVQLQGIMQPSVSPFQFRFADLIVTIMLYWVIYYFSKHNNKFAVYVMSGALIMILFNVFIPHLAVTLITGRYAPGVASGVILNIPVTLYLLRRGLKEEMYNYKMLIKGGLVLIIMVLPLLLVSFAAGKLIENICKGFL